MLENLGKFGRSTRSSGGENLGLQHVHGPLCNVPVHVEAQQ